MSYEVKIKILISIIFEELLVYLFCLRVRFLLVFFK